MRPEERIVSTTPASNPAGTMSPSCDSQPRTRTPRRSASHFFAITPAATRIVVSRALLRPPPRGSRAPFPPVGVVRMAWAELAGDGVVTLLRWSVLRISNATGAPVVRPWYTPLRISTRRPRGAATRSGIAGGAALEVAGEVRRRERDPGGQPSTTQPMAGPCDSPKVVTRRRWPKVFTASPARAQNKSPGGARRGSRAAARRAIDAWCATRSAHSATKMPICPT